jgi:hypothetical protein
VRDRALEPNARGSVHGSVDSGHSIDLSVKRDRSIASSTISRSVTAKRADPVFDYDDIGWLKSKKLWVDCVRVISRMVISSAVGSR